LLSYFRDLLGPVPKGKKDFFLHSSSAAIIDSSGYGFFYSSANNRTERNHLLNNDGNGVGVVITPDAFRHISRYLAFLFFLYAYCFLHHSEYPGFWAFWVNGSPQKYGGTTWIIPIFFYVLILDLSTFATK
jgi:hypothetical protein